MHKVLEYIVSIKAISFAGSNTNLVTTIVLEVVPLLIAVFGCQSRRFLLPGALQVPHPSERPEPSNNNPNRQSGIDYHAYNDKGCSNNVEKKVEKSNALAQSAVAKLVHDKQETPPQSTYKPKNAEDGKNHGPVAGLIEELVEFSGVTVHTRKARGCSIKKEEPE